MWALNPIPNTWGDRIGAFAELVAGGKDVLKTDATWRSGFTPVTGNGIYHGEDYRRPDRHCRYAWGRGSALRSRPLVPHETGAVKEMAQSRRWTAGPMGKPRSTTSARTAVPMSGFAVKGPAGAHVRVEFSEVLGPNRDFDNRNFRSARAEQHYTLKGEGQRAMPRSSPSSASATPG
jgi:alpha-L-rhamnosidase